MRKLPLERPMPIAKRILQLLRGGPMSVEDLKEKSRVIDTKSAVMLEEVQARKALAEIKASKTASELAAEKLPVWCVLAVTTMVVLFLFATLYIPSENVSVLAGLVTLVVTSFTGILRSITDGTHGHKSNGNGNGGSKPPKAE